MIKITGSSHRMFRKPLHKATCDTRLETNHIYQMIHGRSSSERCVGCIMRVHPSDSSVGIPIHTASYCNSTGECTFICEIETWVEISEEQLMEALLGG